jgi:integrase
VAIRTAHPRGAHLTEADLDQSRGAVVARRGQGGRRREVGMAPWGWEQLQPWLDVRRGLPVGPLFCIVNGATRGRHWSSAAARADLRRPRPPHGCGVASRRISCAMPMPSRWLAKACLIVIQRQLGHSNLGITSVYLQGIGSGEIIETVHARRAPMLPVSVSLRL